MVGGSCAIGSGTGVGGAPDAPVKGDVAGGCNAIAPARNPMPYPVAIIAMTATKNESPMKYQESMPRFPRDTRLRCQLITPYAINPKLNTYPIMPAGLDRSATTVAARLTSNSRNTVSTFASPTDL